MQPTRKEIMGHEYAVRLGEKVICWKRETFLQKGTGIN